jgi:hypothetical protein
MAKMFVLQSLMLKHFRLLKQVSCLDLPTNYPLILYKSYQVVCILTLECCTYSVKALAKTSTTNPGVHLSEKILNFICKLRDRLYMYGYIYIWTYFEIIVDSHMLIRNDTERSYVPFIQFPHGSIWKNYRTIITRILTLMEYSHHHKGAFVAPS